jgi:TPR repeat protein
VKQDLEVAVLLYQLSAQQGFEKAQLKLAKCLLVAHSLCVEPTQE